MILDPAPAQGPLSGLVLILSVWGVIADWRYQRNGGKRPGKRDKILFLSAVILVIALFGILALLGANAETISYLSLPIGIILLATWELGRWRVRRTNPVEESKLNVPY